jgi:hypothetical protein
VDDGVWSSNIVWGTASQDSVMFDAPDAPPANYDKAVFEELFGGHQPTIAATTGTGGEL